MLFKPTHRACRTAREVFNSDGSIYGGNSVGNFGADVPVTHGRLQARIPANGFLVFQKL